MPNQTELRHAAEFLLNETLGDLSRENITVLSGQNLKAGHVLGKILTGPTVSGAAGAGNTGNGTISGVAAGTSGVQRGVYKAVCIKVVTNGGVFAVYDPAGVYVGKATVGSAFDNQVGFTINDGGTDFDAGDFFTITVTGGTEKYKEYNPANTDGSQRAIAVLFADVDASAADTKGVGIVRLAEVIAELLVWFSGATAAQKTTGQHELAAVHIAAR